MLTIDQLLHELEAAKQASPLGGETVVVISIPHREPLQELRSHLDVDPDGALFEIVVED